MDSLLIHAIDGLIAIVVLLGGWWAGQLNNRVSSIDLLLRQTREDFCTRAELASSLQSMSDAILRLEAKIDRLSERSK